MIWTILYWFLLVLAVVVGLRAWFWDRAGFRGRPEQRCKKCWYDLTGAPGDVASEAIRCPECGKEHKTKRSMRKTRRSFRLVMLALLLWAGSYAAVMTPKIQRYGWKRAMPDIVLVASFPFLSEERGSGLGSFVLRGEYQVPVTGYESFAIERVGGPFAGWGPAGQSTDYSWLSKRLVFLLGRLESHEVITDSSTVKGAVYSSMITKVVRADEAYRQESRWAHSVVHFEFDTGGDVPPDTMIYANFKVRRLIQGSYRLRIRSRELDFMCQSSSGMRMNGFSPTEFASTREAIEYWSDRFSWASIWMVDQEGKNRQGAVYNGTRLGIVSGSASGEATGDVHYTILETEGNERDTLFYAPVARGQVPLDYRVDQKLRVAQDSSLELEDLIKQNISAHLSVRFDRTTGEWVPQVLLKKSSAQYDPSPVQLTQADFDWFTEHQEFPKYGLERKNPIPPLLNGGVLIGGRISVQVIWYRDGFESKDILLAGDATWWNWGVFAEPETMWNRGNEPRIPQVRLQASTRSERLIAGEVRTNGQTLSNFKNMNYKVVVVIEPDPSPSWHDFVGFRGSRVYTGPLEFPLESWTASEIENFAINGIVPDHAMP
tara:strand:- start:35741 stop:37546 length:1806 start_codon:yes stop_codon:yes gene_type:complete